MLDAGTTHRLSSPGNGNSGSAFEVTVGPVTSPSDATARVIQAVPAELLDAGATYTVSFATNIVGPDAGFWGVMVNDQPYRTVDARDNAGPGVWNLNSFDYPHPGGAATLKFEIITSEPGSVFKLDDVSMVKK